MPGLEMVVPDKDEIDQRTGSASTGKWRAILAVASDGAHLPTRSKARRNAKRGRGQYKEAKGFRIYLVSKNRIVHVATWHQIQDEEQFGVDLAMVAGRIPQDEVRIALLGDGADWLWKHMTACFSGAREVLGSIIVPSTCMRWPKLNMARNPLNASSGLRQRDAVFSMARWATSWRGFAA